jgi:O-antigen/teichoic acid export membrane protein
MRPGLLRTREHLGSAAIVTGAKAIGGVSIVALNIWVARHLPPAAYGVFALASTGMLLIDGVVGSALDAAVVGTTAEVPASQTTGAERAGAVLKGAAGGAALAAVPPIALLVAGPAAATAAALACLAGAGLLLHRSVLVYFQLRERFASYGAVDLAHTAARWACVALVIGGGATSAAPVIAAYATAPWCVVVVVVVAGRIGGHRAAAISRQDFAAVTRLASTAVATTGVGAVVARLDLLLLGFVGASQQAGVLAAASTVALAPTWLGAYLAPVFSGRILPYCRERRLRTFFRDVQTGLLALAIVGMTVGVVAGPLLVARLLPPSYAEAGGVVPVLLVAGVAGFFTFPLVLHTLLFLSPRTYLVMDLVSLPILVVLYVVAARRSGALGVAWITAVSAAVKAVIAHAAAATAIHREEARYAGLTAFAGAGALR